MRGKLLFVLPVLYGLLSLVALALIRISANGWFGVEPDPLSAIFALLLSLPWSLALDHLPLSSESARLLVMFIGISINLLLLYALARRLNTHSKKV